MPTLPPYPIILANHLSWSKEIVLPMLMIQVLSYLAHIPYLTFPPPIHPPSTHSTLLNPPYPPPPPHTHTPPHTYTPTHTHTPPHTLPHPHSSPCILQHALEQELQRRGPSSGEVLSPAAQRAYIDTLSESLSPATKPHSPVRVDDVIRKSEV